MQTVKRAKTRKGRNNKLNRELKKELGKKLVGYSAVAGAVLAIGAAGSEEASATAIKRTQTMTVTTGNEILLDMNILGNDGADLGLGVTQYKYVNTISGYSTTFNLAWAGGDPYATYPAKVHGEFWKSTEISGTGTTAVTITYRGYDAIAIGAGLPIGVTLFYPFAATPIVGDTGGAPWGSLAWNDLYNGFLTTTATTPNPGGDFLTRGFFGVSFDISGSTHYGWVDVMVNTDISLLTVYAWGYEDVAGASINAGEGQEAIPEPATLVTLAMGAASLYAWRRNRKRKSVKKNS